MPKQTSLGALQMMLELIKGGMDFATAHETTVLRLHLSDEEAKALLQAYNKLFED